MTSSRLHFRIEPVILADVSSMLRPSNRRGGDLSYATVTPICWPWPSDSDPAPDAFRHDPGSLRRLEYTTRQQRAFFERDSTCHYVKAATAEGREVVSLARWHYYLRGYAFETDELVEVGEFVPEGVLKPDGGPYNIDFYRGMRNEALKARKEWRKTGEPSWVLMGMVTRKGYRRRGAASMLIRWGVEQARQDGIPAYLEASAQGKPVYERCGFKQVGELVECDCKPSGLDVVVNMARMARYLEEQS